MKISKNKLRNIIKSVIGIQSTILKESESGDNFPGSRDPQTSSGERASARDSSIGSDGIPLSWTKDKCWDDVKEAREAGDNAEPKSCKE